MWDMDLDSQKTMVNVQDFRPDPEPSYPHSVMKYTEKVREGVLDSL
jgi:hypothetical protein